MLQPAEAAAAIAASLGALPVESCRLADAAGRVLRADVHAEREQPPFDRVAMDGIAISSAACADGRRSFRIAGVVAAGAPPATLGDAGECLEVMTGAVLPPGADAVVPFEQLAIAAGVATLADGLRPVPWVNIHRRGSDVADGARVLEAGALLRAPEVAIAAGAGRAALSVARRPSVAVVSTGDELVAPGAPLAAWQLRRSNAYGVAAALRARGLVEVTDDHVPDDPAVMQDRLAGHLERHDVLVLSGGVSAGRFDHVPAVLGKLGVRRVFHKVAQRPGMPFWFGVGAGGRAVFGLPGNPVSTLVCLMRYVVPALARLAGAPLPVAPCLPLADAFEVRHGLTAFLPVDRAAGADGALVLEPHPTHGSGDFTALAGTIGFVELAPGRRWERGTPVPLYTW